MNAAHRNYLMAILFDSQLVTSKFNFFLFYVNQNFPSGFLRSYTRNNKEKLIIHF